MIKRLILSLALALGLLSPSYGAGTIPFSLSQQFDSLGKPLANCFFYTIRASTNSTPQDAFQDAALTLRLPNPMRCDASGRLPQFFLADGLIKVRITDKNGVSQAYPNGANGIDNVQVIGPSGGGGGGGGGVDPTTIAATGDVKSVYGTSVLNGWVRVNGRTIGNASSGASERANADTQALFIYLWLTDASLAVSGGRGASAPLDYAANKTIALPDFRGRVKAGFDDMGNVAAGRLAPPFMTGFGIGATGGNQSHTLTVTEIPSITPTGTVANGAITVITTGGGFLPTGSGTVISNSSPGGAFGTTGGLSASQGTSTFTGNAFGGGEAHSVLQPTIFVTDYIKL